LSILEKFLKLDRARTAFFAATRRCAVPTSAMRSAYGHARSAGKYFTSSPRSKPRRALRGIVLALASQAADLASSSLSRDSKL